MASPFVPAANNASVFSAEAELPPMMTSMSKVFKELAIIAAQQPKPKVEKQKKNIFK